MDRIIEASFHIDPDCVLAILNGSFSRNSESFRLLSDVQVLLRRYVDEWIDSGRDPDGIENPWKRSYGPEAASCAVLGCVDYSIGIALPRGQNNPNLEWRLWGRGRRAGVEQQARSIFVFALASEWRFRLAKCRYCDVYFLLEDSEKQTFKYGTGCGAKHRRLLAASTATNHRRESERTKVIDRVAAEIGRAVDPDEVWDGNGSFRAEVLNTLNHKINRMNARIRQSTPTQEFRPRYPLKKNFLTRNRKMLQQKLAVHAHPGFTGRQQAGAT